MTLRRPGRGHPLPARSGRRAFPSEHPDCPKWGEHEWAPMAEPTRLTLLVEGGKERYEASYVGRDGEAES